MKIIELEESLRRTTLAALILISIVSIGSLALAQQFLTTMTQMPQQHQIEIIARSIQRDNTGTHATGNVQLRITPIHQDEGRTVSTRMKPFITEIPARSRSTVMRV